MQLALTYAPTHAGADQWKAELEWLRRAVDVVGHKEVAYALDVQPSQLTDALLERERKDVKARWIPVVLRMVGEAMRREYLQIVVGSLGYRLDARKARTPEEELHAMRAAIAKLVPGVMPMLEEEMSK